MPTKRIVDGEVIIEQTSDCDDCGLTLPEKTADGQQTGESDQPADEAGADAPEKKTQAPRRRNQESE